MNFPFEKYLKQKPRTQFVVNVPLLEDRSLAVTYRIDRETQEEVAARIESLSEAQFLALVVTKIDGIEEPLSKDFFDSLSIRARKHLLAGLEKTPYYQARNN